jgi:hypothetical protein
MTFWTLLNESEPTQKPFPEEKGLRRDRSSSLWRKFTTNEQGA